MVVRVVGVSAFALAISFLIGAYAWPKHCTLGGGVNEGLLTQGCVAYYRGFGLSKQPGIFGRNYYQLRLASRRPEDGLTDVFYRREGWNAFRGTYPDGTLREEGECWVMLNYGIEPFVNFHNVKNGKYYDPHGSLGGRDREWDRSPGLLELRRRQSVATGREKLQADAVLIVERCWPTPG